MKLKLDERVFMSQKIKVLYVVSPNFGFNFGGQTPIILETIKRWNNNDIEISVFGSNFDINDLSGLFMTPMKNTKIRRLFWSVKLIWHLIFKREKYDIIQVYVQWWGGLLSPLIAHAFKKKAVYVITLDGSDNPGAVIKERLGKIKLWLLKQFDGIIGLSKALIDDCKKLDFTSELLLLPNFLSFDPLEFDFGKTKEQLKMDIQIPTNAKALLFVGSTIYRKGFDLLIDSFIDLSKKNNNLYLIIVGANSKSDSSRVDDKFVTDQKNKLDQAGIDNKVLWTGLVRDQKTLAFYYRLSDVFVFPSRAEGQGNVIVEAMAACLPVVTSRLDGITDMMINQDVNGYLVDKDQAEEISKKVDLLLGSPEISAAVGEKARCTIIEFFGFQAYQNNLANFYCKICNFPK